MEKSLSKLITEHLTEHHPEHMEKKYSISVIKGDRNYIRWSFRNPETGKLERQKNVYLKAHKKYPNKKDRLQYLNDAAESLRELLDSGYIPIEYRGLSKSETTTFEIAVEFCLKLIEAKTGSLTISDYRGRMNHFIDHLHSNSVRNIEPKEIVKKHVVDFLNQKMLTSSARNRNNYLTAISSVFTEMKDQGYIEDDFTKSIKNEKTKRKPDPRFTDEEFDLVIEQLKKGRTSILIYSLLASYQIWRLIEACRVQVQDIDLEKGVIITNTKTKEGKTKKIPDVLRGYLVDYLQQFPKRKPTDLLITPNGIGEWDRDEEGRRKYMSKLFNRSIKKVVELKGRSAQSLRHTAITRIYVRLRAEGLNEDDAIKQLSLITGHTTKVVYEYIHVNDLQLPDEYSRLVE